MPKLISIVGTRPQFIKLAPLSECIKGFPNITHKVIHTGQHFDSNMSQSFFTNLQIPPPDYNLNINSKSHAVMTAEMLIKIEEILNIEKPDWVIVYGDCDTTLAGALCAAKMKIKVAHVEAGLRSFNNDMPEEINRKVVDVLADVLFSPSVCAINNLKNEGLDSKAILSGNIQLDLLKRSLNDVRRVENDVLDDLKLDKGCFVFMTIHRPYNTTEKALKKIMFDISRIGEKFFFPIHPRTLKIIKEFNIEIPQNVILNEPIDYIKGIALMKNSKFVLTDSGGIQPECAFLGKKCITVRSETEWLASIDGGINVLADYNELFECIVEHGTEFIGEFYDETHELECSEIIVERLGGMW